MAGAEGQTYSHRHVEAGTYQPPRDIPPEPLIGCLACRLRGSCLTAGLSEDELKHSDGLVSSRDLRRQGECVYRAGTPFRSLYVIRGGMFKSCASGDNQRTQVVGLHMRGDVLGFDGIDSGGYQNDVVALEDGEVCAISLEVLSCLSRTLPRLHRNFIRAMSGQVRHNYGMMLLLGEMGADERVMAFLLDYSRRLAEFGYSGREFNMRMTREEIASYIGIKVETVSRVMTRLKGQGLIAVQNKHFCILDRGELQRRAGETEDPLFDTAVPVPGARGHRAELRFAHAA